MSTANSVSTGSADIRSYLQDAAELASHLEVLRKGSFGWLYLALGIAAWDLLADEDEQLTRAFRRSIHGKHSGPAVGLIWGIVTAHLFGAIPQKYDPIHYVLLTARRHRDGHQGAGTGAGTR